MIGGLYSIVLDYPYPYELTLFCAELPRLSGEGRDFLVYAGPVGHPFCPVWH